MFILLTDINSNSKKILINIEQIVAAIQVNADMTTNGCNHTIVRVKSGNYITVKETSEEMLNLINNCQSK